MAEITQEEKRYEVTLPLEKFEALIEAKYAKERELCEAQANYERYRDKFWGEETRHKNTQTKLDKALAEIETYKQFFQQNAETNMAFNMWLTEQKGDEEA